MKLDEFRNTYSDAPIDSLEMADMVYNKFTPIGHFEEELRDRAQNLIVSNLHFINMLKHYHINLG